MGVIIYTNTPDKYTEGETVYMEGLLKYPPTGIGVTYVLNGTMSESEAKLLAPLVEYRLVVTPKRKPKFSSSPNILVDWKKQSNDLSSIIKGVFVFPHRLTLFKRLKFVPIPYLLEATKNIVDYRLWRLVARSNMVLPDQYVRALFAYGIEPKSITVAKQKKNKRKDISHPLFREGDKWIDFIIRNNEEVANELRIVAPDLLPKGVKKRIQEVGDVQWP
tara:strand:- start:3454 stop:4110 length:657 start_codon:yes stop_codon:yes gene_type:complete